VVQGNFIGTDAGGSLPLPNVQGGVHIANSSNGNTIGGTTAVARNVISGNTSSGISISNLSTGNIIQGNFIGTDAGGSAVLGNSGGGVDIATASNTVGETAAGAGNVISANGSVGVRIAGSTATGNVVQGNLIGTNAAGTGSLPNTGGGVVIDLGSGNTIGGDSAAARNVVSGNGQNGVRITGSSATGNLVRGNFIGTDVNGSSALGNTLAGVSLEFSASNNTIGGTTLATAQDVIAFNGETGIQVAGGAGSGNWLRFNEITLNGGLGIDLGGDNVTANDAGDTDSGPNDLQNFPGLTSATSGGLTTMIQGSLNSTANTQFVIDLFNSPSCDLSGNGEGQTWFHPVTQSTDSSGNLSFTASFGFGLTLGTVVTAIATSPGNSTSEFSACVTVITP